MYSLVIRGFKTKEQAEELVKWYEGQGEQDASIWFNERMIEGAIDVSSMDTDLEATYPLTWVGDCLSMKVSPV